jgi:O-antigen ligase
MPNLSYVVHKKWIILWACFFALGWLLPNHQLPWPAFHHDAWCALASAIAAAPLLFRTQGPWAIPSAGLVCGFAVCIPLFQWGAGLIPLAGHAWMSVAYLLGCFMVMVCAARWEASAPGDLLDGLFIALGMAALLSVWVQLRQWLVFDTGWEWWSMGGDAARPSANFGQPNQAATFLCLGLGALAWGAWRQKIRWITGLLAAAYLLFGIALTGSRTSWLGLVWVVVAVWYWRRIWPDARTPWFISALLCYLALCVVALQGLASSGSAISSDSALQRWKIWGLCWDALWASPWVGYGWYQTALAELRALDLRASGFGPFNSAHNLFIDLLLWCGIPLGGALCIAILAWVFRRFGAVKTADQAILLLLVLLVLNHSMLEYPLHYAYILLPVGWLVGALEVRMDGGRGRWLRLPRAVVVLLYLSATTLLTLIITDYFPIEQANRNLRLERLHVQTEPWTPPDTLVLSHMSRHIAMVRAPTTTQLSDAALLQREHLAEVVPDGYAMFYLAVAEALNHRPEQAVLWLQRYCKLKPADGCVSAARDWAQSGAAHPEIAAIAWPVKFDKATQDNRTP